MILCGAKYGYTLHLSYRVYVKDDKEYPFSFYIRGPKGGLHGLVGLKRDALLTAMERMAQVLKETAK